MPEESVQWRPKDSYKGVFNDYTIMGTRFENASGFEIGWEITAWRTTIDLIHAYWVSEENFYSATLHVGYKGSPIYRIEIYHPHITENIELAERKAVLKAIKEWVQRPAPIVEK